MLLLFPPVYPAALRGALRGGTGSRRTSTSRSWPSWSSPTSTTWTTSTSSRTNAPSSKRRWSRSGRSRIRVRVPSVKFTRPEGTENNIKAVFKEAAGQESMLTERSRDERSYFSDECGCWRWRVTGNASEHSLIFTLQTAFWTKSATSTNRDTVNTDSVIIMCVMVTEAELLCNSDQHDVSQAELPCARSPNLPNPSIHLCSPLSFILPSFHLPFHLLYLLFTRPFTFHQLSFSFNVL